MPGAADFVQRAVHAMEAGGLAVWIRRGLVVVVIVGVAVYYMIWQFRGLSTSQAMDQAQVARSLLKGGAQRRDGVIKFSCGALRYRELQRFGQRIGKIATHFANDSVNCRNSSATRAITPGQSRGRC